jgi:hypothetical protein
MRRVALRLTLVTRLIYELLTSTLLLKTVVPRRILIDAIDGNF